MMWFLCFSLLCNAAKGTEHSLDVVPPPFKLAKVTEHSLDFVPLFKPTSATEHSLGVGSLYKIHVDFVSS